MKKLAGLCTSVILAACTATDNTTSALGVALSPDGGRHLSPSYSPDGSKVAYWDLGREGVQWQLWVADADFKSPQRLPVTSIVNLPPRWSPDGKRIATTSGENGLGDVVVLSATGGDVKRITHGAGVEAPIAWNPDGDRIAFFESKASGVFTTSVVSTSTGKTVPLIPGEGKPLFGWWSPDGSRIAYNLFDGSRSTIWVADSAGNNPRQLTTEGFEGYASGFPLTMWSPDSKEVIYESRRTGTADIWVAPVDGSKPRQITRDLRNDGSASFSSDSKWIVFVSDRGQQTDVWVAPAAGGTEQRVTDDVTEESNPMWRPNSNSVAYVTTTNKSSLWSYSLADSSEHRLTPDSIRVNYFSVSPDGKQVLNVVPRGGGIDELAVSNIDGSGWRSLLSGGGTVLSPVWSPDGTKIAFSSDRGGTADVWVIDATGGAARQLTNWPGFESPPIWNAKGSALYFNADREARLGDVWSVPPAGGAPTRVTQNGTVGPLGGVRGSDELFVGVISPKGGQLGWARLRPGGVLQTLWEETNSLGIVARVGGDSVIVVAEQGGAMQAILMPVTGGKGRKILKPNEAPQWWSRDGSSLLYFTLPAATADLAILNVATGATRQLTHTPEVEAGAEFTPDEKSVLFRRVSTVQRIFGADVSKLMTTR